MFNARIQEFSCTMYILYHSLDIIPNFFFFVVNKRSLYFEIFNSLKSFCWMVMGWHGSKLRKVFEIKHLCVVFQTFNQYDSFLVSSKSFSLSKRTERNYTKNSIFFSTQRFLFPNIFRSVHSRE